MPIIPTKKIIENPLHAPGEPTFVEQDTQLDINLPKGIFMHNDSLSISDNINAINLSQPIPVVTPPECIETEVQINNSTLFYYRLRPPQLNLNPGYN